MTNERTGDANRDMADALRALGHRIDPEPDELAVAALVAYSCRTTGADIAALTYDSALDDDPPDDAVSAARPRRLTFVGGGLTLDLEVVDGRSLTGRLDPPGPAEIELRRPGRTSPAATDELGRFRVAAVPSGPVSIRCETGATEPVITDWFSL